MEERRFHRSGKYVMFAHPGNQIPGLDDNPICFSDLHHFGKRKNKVGSSVTAGSGEIKMTQGHILFRVC